VHHLALEVGVAVILAGAIVQVAVGWLMRSQLLQPALVILVQAGLVVVDEHRRSNVHGVDQGIHKYHLSPDVLLFLQAK
jgi:hypothetical protein